MADTDVKALFLQVDASVELLRRNLAAGEAPLAKLEQRAQRTAANVDASLGKMGGRFGEFAKLAEDASSRFERSFNESFARVQQQAQNAVTLPQIKGGGLNLGADELRASAASARQRADALALIEQAAIRASAGEGQLTRETRAYLAAAQAARIEAERTAQTLLAEAGAAQRLEVELAGLAAEGRQLAVVNRQVTGQTAAQRAGFQQLSFQVGDVATQFGSGTSVLQIFAQQAGQTVQAIGLMTTESKGLIGFLGGPYGQILTAAIVLITTLGAAHIAAADAENKHSSSADDLKSALERLSAASAENDRRTRISIQLDLDAADSARKRAIETLRLADANLKSARARSLDPTLAGEGGFNPGATAAASFDSQAVALRKEIADLEKKGNVARGALGQRDIAAARDPRTKITQTFEDEVDRLKRAFEGARGVGGVRINERQFRQGLDLATERRDRDLEALADSKKTGRKKGPSADTLASRAESARQKVLSDDISFNDQERAARRKLIEASKASAESEVERDRLIREDINAEADAERRKIILQAEKGKISEAEKFRLAALNEATRTQRLQNADADRAMKIVDRQYEARLQTLDADIELLRIQLSLAKTQAQRKDLAEKLLAAEQQRTTLGLERTVATSSDPNAVGVARGQLGLQPKINRAQGQLLADNFKSPIAQYRDDLIAATDDINAAFENVGARGLQSLEDGLVDAITGARSLGDVFKSVASSIVADLIRIAVQKVIVNSLGSFLGFADGGAIPGFADGGAIQGFAGGGRFKGPGGPRSDNLLAMVSPGEFIINAGATRENLALLEMINSGKTPRFADGGLIPTPASLQAPSFPSSLARGGTAGASGPVMVMVSLTEDLNARIDNRAANVSVQVVRQAAPQIVETATNNTVAQLRRPRL